MKDPIKVDDDNVEEIKAKVEGRIIINFHQEPDSGESFGMTENTVTLTLDDGAQLDFIGIGYDASSCITEYAPAQKASDLTAEDLAKAADTKKVPSATDPDVTYPTSEDL